MLECQGQGQTIMRYFFREWRQSVGLTMSEFGQIAGYSEGQVSKIETGERDFSGDFLQDFAQIIGCKVWEPLQKLPKPRTSKITADEKKAIQRRIQTRAKEIRKLRRAAKSNGGKKLEPDNGDDCDCCAGI
jgi:transcriptional regulator with XRE-family HTH domain